MLVSILLLVMAACSSEAAAPTIIEKEVIVEKIVEVEKAAAPQEDVTWVTRTNQGGTSFITKSYLDFAEKVKARTGGKLNIEVHYGGELGYKAADGLSVIEKRSVDAGEIIGPFEQSTHSEFGFFILPYFFGGFDDWAFFENLFRPTMDEVVASRNAKCLYTYSLTLQHYFSKKPFLTKDDLAGVKMRTYNKETTDMLTALGAAPLRVDFAELYTALQRGTVDGMVTSASSTVDLRGWEVLSHVNLTSFAPGGLNCFTVNQDAWDEIPAEWQVILLEEAEKQEDYMRVFVPGAEDSLLKILEDNGMTIVEVPQETLDVFRAETQFIRDEFFNNNPSLKSMKDEFEAVRYPS
jgi:TRAP-type C4-dicarboxylate transport system substrate-binding protein